MIENFNFQPMQELPEIDLGFLKIPKCDSCGAHISELNKLAKNYWICHICQRSCKLPNWYHESKIVHTNYKLKTNSQPFPFRILFLIDVGSSVLNHMVLPLVIESLNRVDEIGIIALTPFPTIFEFSNKLLKMITLTDDCEYDIKKIFLHTQNDYNKIKKIIKQIEKLIQYQQKNNLLNNCNPLLIAQQFITRFNIYKSLKIIQFSWFKGGDFKLEIMNNYRNHYQLFIIDQSKTLSQQMLDEYGNIMKGNCNIYYENELEQFYDNAYEYLITSPFGWDGQIKFIGSKIINYNENKEIEYSDFITLPNMNHKSVLKLKLQRGQNTQILVGYMEQNKYVTLIYNL